MDPNRNPKRRTAPTADNAPIVVTAVIGVIEQDGTAAHTMVEAAFLLAASHLDVAAQNGVDASVEFRYRGRRFYASTDDDGLSVNY